MAGELGKRVSITLEHLERVKWYAPHIRHVVLDICCSATSAPAQPPPEDAQPAGQVPGKIHSGCPIPLYNGLSHPVGLQHHLQDMSAHGWT